MRDYSKFASTFWTGETGRKLRSDRNGQVVAAYLFTGPMANMIGLYHLPVALISDHTGIPLRGASEALRRVCATGFSSFEGGLEVVFVHEMAAHQIGEPLKVEDNRVKAIVSQWQQFRKCKFYLDFHTRYRESFHLPAPSPLQAPSKPGAGAGDSSGTGTASGAEDIAAPPPAGVPDDDHKGRPRDPVWDAIVSITGADASIRSVASHVGKVKKALLEANPPYTAEEILSLREVASADLPWSAGRRLTLGEVEKNIGLVRSNAEPVRARGKGANLRDRVADGLDQFLSKGQ